MCNDAYRRLYQGSAAILMPGMKFEALLRDGLARGEFIDAIGHEEAWLAADFPADPAVLDGIATAAARQR